MCRFSFDEMLDLKGNTAVYMLYAHARIASIIRKVGKEPDEVAKTAKLQLEHPSEIALALHILRFPEAVDMVLQELAPNRLTEYLYELSDKFNSFYGDCKVRLCLTVLGMPTDCFEQCCPRPHVWSCCC